MNLNFSFFLLYKLILIFIDSALFFTNLHTGFFVLFFSPLVKGVKLLPIIFKCLTQLISNQSSERKLVLHQVLNVFNNVIFSLARHSLSSSDIESFSQVSHLFSFVQLKKIFYSILNAVSNNTEKTSWRN